MSHPPQLPPSNAKLKPFIMFFPTRTWRPFLLRQQHAVLKIEQQPASALPFIDIAIINTKSTRNIVAEENFMLLEIEYAVETCFGLIYRL